MAEVSPLSPRSPGSGAAEIALPVVRLEFRNGTARPVTHELLTAGFLIGSVPGCDLRLPGADLAPVICLITRTADGVALRKLAPAQPVLVNGQPVSQAVLTNGDQVTLGPFEIRLAIREAPTANAPVRVKQTDRARVAAPVADAAHVEEARQEFHKQVAEFRRQVADFHQEQKLLEEEDRKRQEESTQRQAQLDSRRQQLEEQIRDVEADRAFWSRRREEIEHEGRKLQERERNVAAAVIDLDSREKAFEQNREQWTDRQADLEKQAAEVERQQQELAGARQELADLRQHLYDRYRERRDRLAGLQEAVGRAARKVQERKQELDAEVEQWAARHKERETRQSLLDARAAELDQRQKQLDEECRLVDARREDLHEDLANRLADVQARATKVAEERQALDKSQAQHQADLVRLDRLQATLEQRQRQLDEQTHALEHRTQELERVSREIEDQAGELDAWHTRLTEDADKLARQKAEQDTAAAQVAQRAAAFEGQQAMLATLRTRLERMREELRRQEQQLTDQRVRQEAAEADLQERLQEAERLRAQLDSENQLREQERQQFAERSTLLEQAVAQLRQAQEALAREEADLRQERQAVESTAALNAEEAGLLKARAGQLEELHQRLETDRQALRERSDALAQAEQVRDALQEQLRKRAEELAAKQKGLEERERKAEADMAALAARCVEIEKQQQEAEAHWAAIRQDVEARAAELDQLRDNLARREQILRRHIERLKQGGRNIGAERKALSAEKKQWSAQQEEELARLARAQSDLAAVQREAGDLCGQLPDLELRAQAAADKLAQAREQLGGHLAEIHAYARQSREAVEALQSHMQAESERLRQRELALHQSRDEHRLAVAAFRQQLIDWQAQLAAMKTTLAQGETRLERRQALVAEQARQMDATSARLARQAEELEEQERRVADRRDEMARHLDDMRQWYRRKLRELAGIDEQQATAEAQTSKLAAHEDKGEGKQAPAAEETDTLLPETPASILALTAEVDPGDRRLGELLRSFDLIDADTLTALLVEARRQRRSLRQVLLAGGTITLYQLALIEAGNMDGLVLGPVRVVDRLRVTPRETVYRVFDPRRGPDEAGQFLLRHLSETEALDAVHPDEFRQRFAGAAAVQHPHLAVSREVLEIAGRPAVLQEWPAGLPSTDWPPLASVPGVWFRLISQAALGLHTIHQAGLVHGHLHASLVILTAEGTVKLCGLGEPPWLVNAPAVYAADPDTADDLRALGSIAAGWIASPRRKTSRGKSLPGSLQAILARLTAPAAENSYPSAATLLEDLDRAGSDVPANAEAWDRLLRHVRDNAAAEMAMRRSA
jgi:chromosome segregation ATPase